MIGIVGTPGADQRICCNFERIFGQNLGIGIGEREDDRLFCHASNHIFGQNIGAGKPQKEIGTVDHIAQRFGLVSLRESGLLRVHAFGPVFVDKPVQISEPNILTLHTQFHQHIEAGNPCSPATG